MIVFVDQVAPSSQSKSAREIARLEAIVRQLGVRVHVIPDTFETCSASDALCWLGQAKESCVAIWLGFIPSPARYAQLFDAARERGVTLINTPEEHEFAMNLQRYYPRIADLTAKSVVLPIDATTLEEEAHGLGYPLFVKGAIKSNKDLGASACIAHDKEDLCNIVAQLRQRPGRTGGQVVMRELLDLRDVRASTPGHLPVTREYRAFVLRGEVVSLGFYWDDVSVARLSGEEMLAIESLAKQVATRLEVPYLAVDIAQKRDGSWCVIEVGDAQFMGLSQNSAYTLWQGLADAL